MDSSAGVNPGERFEACPGERKTDKQTKTTGKEMANGKRLAYLCSFLAESPKQQHNHMDGSSAHLNFMVCFSHSNQASCYLG